ncbi:putative AlkP superfamily pyrophosphatase or phosphodiesterase [Roseimicrobium gellanilyticum]|uniref:Putative AlkP superfamily pyrophosphatase or phosphodiesterase n=2 Tax=Roseimicrobium gellanilyticum TaxID=748857 RepID=A0A366HS66_9BACT|nr:putative AlkP superfamily pyrophosphatase or phosphodiesterase [Roseimicrobium gellanilyticum]
MPCASPTFAQAPAATNTHPIVVLLSVDGLANFYLDDPKAEIPHLRGLMKEGVRAQSMKASLPTVTWPNHTTLVTGVQPGKHGVLGNQVLDRATGEIVPFMIDPIYNKEELVQSPTIYDVAKEAGMKTAALIWPATRGAKTLDWTVPDVGNIKLVEQHATPSLLKEFSEAGIPWEKQEEWWATKRIRERDGMFVQMAKHVLSKHQPHLLLMHLVELDHTQHGKGPNTPEAYEALKAADERVGEMWEFLKTTLPGRATLIVVSDHGFYPWRQAILPNVLLRQEKLLRAIGSKITTDSKVRAVDQGGSSFIYIRDKENRASIAESLIAKFKEVEGISAVLTPEQFAPYGLGDPATTDRVPDLVLTAKSGYAFFDVAGGDVVVMPKEERLRGTHGYNPDEPAMQATFVAVGAGIQAGARLGDISNTSIAPTLAALLGLKMPSADGPVLQEVLETKAAE